MAMSTSDGVEFVRTPEERFVDLEGWGYETQYVEVDGLRMAWVEEGRSDAAPLLLLHGEPTWGYLYRRMIPLLVAAGHRVVVPDLIGFGRSDKPVDRDYYTYERHVAWMKSFVEELGLEGITLFGQDWGGLIGLRLAAENPERFERIVLGNTVLPTGEPMSDGFMNWQRASQGMEFMDPGRMLQGTTAARELTEGEMDGYRAPFPDATYQAGALVFPMLVATGPDDPSIAANRAAWEVLEQWTKPVLTLWCPDDPVLGGYQSMFVDRIPGAAGQPHQAFSPGGHFIQDDRGEEVAAAMVEWLGSRTA